MATLGSDDLWDRLASGAGRGSSGHWTAILSALASVGGCSSEEEAIAALREKHADRMADPDYRTRAVFLASLPRPVQEGLHDLKSGEGVWRIEDVSSAIEALAAAGRVVLGLHLRDYHHSGSFKTVTWSSYEPTGDVDADVDRGRTAALSSLERQAIPGEWIVVTWR